MGTKSDRPTVEIDAEKSMVKMTLPRLLALIAVVVAAANFVSTRVSSLASHADVETTVDEHSEHPHPSTDARIDQVVEHNAQQDAKDAVQDEQLKRLEPLPERVGAIDAKIDLLLSSEMEEKPNAMRRAARKIRAEAKRKGQQDPLADVDGL